MRFAKIQPFLTANFRIISWYHSCEPFFNLGFALKKRHSALWYYSKWNGSLFAHRFLDHATGSLSRIFTSKVWWQLLPRHLYLRFLISVSWCTRNCFLWQYGHITQPPSVRNLDVIVNCLSIIELRCLLTPRLLASLEFSLLSGGRNSSLVCGSVSSQWRRKTPMKAICLC